MSDGYNRRMHEPARPVPFELTGGALCLDFVNTIDNRPVAERRRDLLVDFTELVRWARQADAIGGPDARALSRAARQQPKRAAQALARATALRESVHRVFAALASGRSPADDDLAHLSGAAVEAMQHQRLAPDPQGPHPQGFTWAWDDASGDNLDRIWWPIARSAEDLLVSGRHQSVRACAADTCGWLFLDTSRSQSRRWCDMRVCGNRAKVKRFYRRARRSLRRKN